MIVIVACTQDIIHIGLDGCAGARSSQGSLLIVRDNMAGCDNQAIVKPTICMVLG